MIKALGPLCVTVALLATAAPGFARAVPFGSAPHPTSVEPGVVQPGVVRRNFVEPGVVRPNLVNSGIADRDFDASRYFSCRRVFLSGTNVVVVPFPYYPFPLNGGYPPGLCATAHP